MYGHKPSLDQLSGMGLPAATLNTTSNSEGGYLVPEVLADAILELMIEYGVIRRLADVVPMSSDTWKTSRWVTGVTAYWISEGQAPSQSEPGWDMVTLTAKNLAAYGKMSRQLNEDSLFALGEKWAMAAGQAFARAEDNAAFNGDGTSTYGGITGLFPKLTDAANAASVYTATGHSSVGALTLADYSAVVGMYPTYQGARPAWLCHKEVWAASMMPLQLAAGGATPADIRGRVTPEFLGYPVEFVEVAPRLAEVSESSIPILFGDLKLTTKLGDRRRQTFETGKINDDMIRQLMTLFASSRVDIVNHTITDPKNSAKPGPILGLKLDA